MNNTLLINEEVTGEIREIKGFLETNDNGNMTTPEQWDSAKADLRGKFMVIKSHLEKQESSWIDNLSLYLKHLGKDEQKTPKSAGGKK